MTVSNFECPEQADYVRWVSMGVPVEKRYRSVVRAVVLSAGDGVLVVEPDHQPDNAVIYSQDGTQRVRIVNPLGTRGALCFTECGYEGGCLTLVARLRGLEVACVIDTAGNVLHTQELR